MKTAFTILFIAFSFAVLAQVPEPSMYSLMGYGGSGADQMGSFVTKTNDGGFIVLLGSNSNTGTGNIDSFCSSNGNRTIFVKYNADASVKEWSKCYNYNTGDSSIGFMFPVPGGDLILGGAFSSSVGYGFFVARQDAAGSILWRHNYSKGNGSVILRGMLACEDGGYILTATSRYIDTNVVTHYGSLMKADIFVLKVDSDGNKVWAKVIGGTGDETIYNIINAPGDGCYIFGSTQSNDNDCTGYHGGIDGYVVRLDKDGNILWHKDIGGSGEDGSLFAWSVSNNKGGIICAARTESSDGDVHHHIGDIDYWVSEIDSDGNFVWENCYGSTTFEFPTAICKATDGSIWITGNSFGMGGQVNNSYGNGDAWVVHTDSVGTLLSARVIGSSAGDGGQMIYPLADGKVITGGLFSKNDFLFNSVDWYGVYDVFLSILSPWPVSIREITSKDNLRVYPNPTTEKFFITAESEITITINDVTGRSWLNNRVVGNNGNVEIDVSQWPKGLYLVQISNPDGGATINKLIVQ